MENKFRGTQGKWVVEYYPAQLNKMMQSNFGIRVDDGVKTPICKLPCSTSDKQTKYLIDRQAADSQLIAAAPDLLELLIDIIKDSEFVIESARGASYYHDCNIDIEDLEVLINKAKETVNKILKI